MTEAHDQAITHHYTIHYPEHEPREKDPHYVDFEEYKRRTKATAKCAFGESRGGDFSECQGGLEVHHGIIEFAQANAVDFKLLERDYPGISNADEVGAWIETDVNLVYYCAKHHRGHGGVHCASASDWTAEKYVRNMIS